MEGVYLKIYSFDIKFVFILLRLKNYKFTLLHLFLEKVIDPAAYRNPFIEAVASRATSKDKGICKINSKSSLEMHF
jgi:hypothetical protein